MAEKEKGFFGKLVEKLDEKLERKSKEKKCGCDCDSEEESCCK